MIYLSLVLLLASSMWLARAVSRSSAAERALVSYLFLMLQVLVVGYTVSQIGKFGDSNWWVAVSAVTAACLVVLAWRLPSNSRLCTKLSDETETQGSSAEQRATFVHTLLMVLLGITASLVVVANLATALFTAPHNIDSHTCHLARTAHFLQQGSLHWYPTNMWAQVIHPRNHPVTLAYAWKLGGENATQLVNLSAWMMSSVCVWGVVFNLLQNRMVAWICSLLSLLLVNGMLIATTTQSDMIIVVQGGTAIYFLTAWLRTGGRRYLFLLSLPIFICLGVKASAVLLIPAVSIVALGTLFVRRSQFNESIVAPGLIVAMSMLAAGIAALPTGYVQNIARYGHPLGIEDVRKGHTLEGLTAQQKVAEAGKNVLRYIMDSTSLDGVKPNGKVGRFRDTVVQRTGELLHQFNVDLERNDHSKRKFLFSRLYRNHEDFWWWGVAGVLLIWPAVIFSLCFCRTNRMATFFAFAFLVFLLSQGVAQYDPWRGRYFSWISSVAMVPVALMVSSLLKSRGGQVVLTLVTIAVCLTSGRSLLYRSNSFFVDRNKQVSIFSMDRIEQITRNTPDLAGVIRKFEDAVPAAANVTIALSGKNYLYPYYGEHLQHTITYVRPNLASTAIAEGNYDFLVFSDGKGVVLPEDDDLLLGSLSNGERIFLKRGTMSETGE